MKHIKESDFTALDVFRWTAKRWCEWRKGPGAVHQFIDDAANDAFNEWLAANSA